MENSTEQGNVGFSVNSRLGPESEPLCGQRILVVDDTADNRLLIRRFLQRAGAAVEVASDGIQAVKLTAAQSFDVIVLDMHMPGMNGEQVFRAIRAQGVATPVVALTGAGGVEERREALRSGFADYLLKPIDPQTLVLKVAGCRE